MAEDNTPTNVVDDVVIAKDDFGRNVTVPVDENGNVILYRATDNPEKIKITNFTKQGDIRSAGLGRNTYFTTNADYSFQYAINRNNIDNFKYTTNIKPNEILNLNTKISENIELAKALGVPEEFWVYEWRRLFDDKIANRMGFASGTREFFNKNINTLIENGYKALGTSETGTGVIQPYAQYEIVPLITENNNYNIKPISKLTQEKEINGLGVYNETPIDTPTNVVDDIPTLNTDLVWENDALERRNIGDKNPSWADNVIPQNNILKPNLKFEDLRKIVPQIIDGTVSDVDFTRFGIWLMSKSPEIAFGTKSFSSPDALADITKIVIFNGKNPSDLINKNTLEIIKNEIGYKEGSRVIDYVPPDNRLSKSFKLEPQKSLVGLSDNLILQFGAEEGPFANAQQRMKQTIINEHNKLYKNADDYFILFRGGELTDDPMQSFSKSGERSYNIALHFDKNLTDKGVDAYYVNKNDFIDLNSLGLDYDNEKELIVYKEAVENPYSKTVMKEGQTVNFLDKGRVKFLQDNWISISDEFPKKGFILPDTSNRPFGPGAAYIDEILNANTQLVNKLPLETVVKNRIKNLITTKTKQLAKPGSLLVKAVDAWEFGVIGLMAAGVAFNEIDEVPTIINNTAINMFNSMTAPYGIAPVEKEEYDIDYEFINTVLDTGSKVMPTDIIIEKLKPYSLEEGEDVILPGTGVTATTGAKQQFEPYGEELAKRAEKTVNMKRDEVKQKILESKGVQEEKMFEQAKPKKSSGGGSGAKIL
jgi:hypothetical protein